LSLSLNKKDDAHFRFKEFPETGFLKNHPFLAMSTLTSESSGLIQKSRGPMLIAARPIITKTQSGEFLKCDDI
jgi:hypothetical protein